MDPTEAVRCHHDIRAEQSMAIHWGTFPLTGEPILEPPAKLAEAREAASLDPERFVCFEHGETRVFGSSRETPPAGGSSSKHESESEEAKTNEKAKQKQTRRRKRKRQPKQKRERERYK